MNMKVMIHMAAVWIGSMPLANAVQAETFTIPGSGNPEYVLEKLAVAFNSQQSLHKVIVPPSTGTAGALRDVGAGTAVMGRVGRSLKEDERNKGLSYLALGRDPVVFVGGAKVTASTVTHTQVVEAFGGKITDWRELGGTPGPIRAIGREISDASRQAISRVVKPFESIAFGENVKVVHLDPQLIELLDRFPTSLGFLNSSALFACKTKVVRLGLNGTAATLDNIENGRYPLWLELGLIYKAGGPGVAGRAFIEFVKSPAGTRILKDHGVLPTA